MSVQRISARSWLLVLVLGATAVLAVWVADNRALPGGGGEWYIAVGRVTGLEGTYLALATVVLLARVPWLDTAFGMPRLAAAHRWIGEGALWLLVAHTVFIIWGYRIQAHATVTHETRYVVLDLPDMLAATVGLGMFVLVGVASLRMARRRLRYETWQFIHLYVYLALVLSFAHEFATGDDFATHGLNRALWIALYAIAGGLLLCFRVVVPVVRSLRHRLRVAEIMVESPTSTSIRITGERLDRWPTQPGQFMIWRFLSRRTWWEAHPFSLSERPRNESFRITVGDCGDFTHRVRGLSLGCRVIAEGPFGVFLPDASTRPALLIAAGSGIAPVRAMLESWPETATDVTLVYRARSPHHFALRNELDALAARRRFTVHYVAGARDVCLDLFDADVLQTLVRRPLLEHVSFVCGPDGFTECVTGALRAAGVPARNIHSERFRL